MGDFTGRTKVHGQKYFLGIFLVKDKITGGFVSRWEKCFRWTLNEPKLSHNGPKIHHFELIEGGRRPDSA